MTDRRLIEDSLPLAEISAASVAEKKTKTPHPRNMHLWWARRPLAACRTALYASYVPNDQPKQDLDWIRALAEKDVRDIPDNTLRLVRDRISKLASGGKPPRLLDPFAGGGAIPIEALRLGFDVEARDLNPVAWTVLKATVEYPSKLGRHVARGTKPEVKGLLALEDTAKTKKLRFIQEFERCSKSLIERAAAASRDPYGQKDCQETIAAYKWCRTVRCANPACRGIIPLVREWVLSKRKDAAHWIEPIYSADRTSFVTEMKSGKRDASVIPDATIIGGKARCPHCNEVMSSKTLQAEGQAGRLGEQMLAVVYTSSVGASGKQFRAPGPRDTRAFSSVPAVDWMQGGLPAIPDEPLPTKLSGGVCTPYGFTSFGDLFNQRQKFVLAQMNRLIEQIIAERTDSWSDLGDAAETMTEAMRVYLALLVSRLADFNNTLVRWQITNRQTIFLFSKQAMPMVWDYVETAMLNDVGGSAWSIRKYMARSMAAAAIEGSARVERRSATDAEDCRASHESFDVVFTDPPYYGSIYYSDLSDFFYVWLRRSLGDLFPQHFSTQLTPKRSELIECKHRKKTPEWYEAGMGDAFSRMRDQLKDSGILVLVFAHKSTAAWETLLKALLSAGFVVTASWPIETEDASRMISHGTASLSSSVFIVCRKRSQEAVGFLDEVEPELADRLHERLDYFWSQGIRGADFFMSAIGPAVEVFGRHKRVLKLSGDEVTIAELLDKVRGIVADYALQRIVHGEAAGNVDEASRFYVIWRWAFGTAEVESGEAIHMAQSMGVEFNELVAEKGVLNKKGDKVSLKGPLDRKKVKGLGEPAATGTLAPLIDVLHRAANLWAAGERQDLADFLATALPPGGADRMQRLAQSIVDVLPPGDKERGLYENFLVGARSLPAPTKKDEAAVKQQKLF